MQTQSGMPTIEDRLRCAVDPYGDHRDDGIEMLLWRTGRMHEQIEAAHHWLDRKGAPQTDGDGVLTVRGRMDALDNAQGRL